MEGQRVETVGPSKYRLQAGAARAPLPAIIGERMGGFKVRGEPSIGIHDQPHAKALCLDNGHATLIIVTLDMHNITAEVVAQIRRHIRAATAIPEHNVLISYSHTHSGPLTPFFGGEWRRRIMTIWGDWPDDPERTNLLIRLVAGAAIEAWHKRQPAKLGFGQGEIAGVSRVRADAGVLDTQVMVLLVTDLNDDPIAVMVNFACHPAVLRHDNLLTSADYPWATMALVELVYPQAQAMFAQGAGGHVAPHPRLWGKFENAERMGRILGAEAIKIVNEILLRGCSSDIQLVAKSVMVPLPQEKTPTVEEAKALVDKVQGEIAPYRERLKAHIATHGDCPDNSKQKNLRYAVERAQAGLVWAEITLESVQRQEEIARYDECEVQALRLGDALLVGMAAEVFNDLGQKVKEALGHGRTFFLGYANGWRFIPTERCLTKSGHKKIAHRSAGWWLLPEAGPVLVRGAIELARTL